MNVTARHSNSELAAFVSATLTVIVAVLVISSVTFKPIPPDGPLFVTATGRDYRWHFEEREGDGGGKHQTSANELCVDAGRPVVMELRSDDYIYAMVISELDVNQICVPGQTYSVEFIAPESGQFEMVLGSFCGTPLYHNGVMGTLTVESSVQHQGPTWDE